MRSVDSTSASTSLMLPSVVRGEKFEVGPGAKRRCRRQVRAQDIQRLLLVRKRRRVHDMPTARIPHLEPPSEWSGAHVTGSSRRRRPVTLWYKERFPKVPRADARVSACLCDWIVFDRAVCTDKEGRQMGSNLGKGWQPVPEVTELCNVWHRNGADCLWVAHALKCAAEHAGKCGSFAGDSRISWCTVA